MKKLFCALAAVMMTVCMLASCAATPKTFTYKNMSVTLTSSFSEAKKEDYESLSNMAFESEDFAVFVLDESKSELNEILGYTLDFDGYKGLVAASNETDKNEIKEQDGLTSFEYDYTNEENTVYHYFVCLFEAEEDFWIVQFAGEKSVFDENRDTVIGWAKSVTFS